MGIVLLAGPPAVGHNTVAECMEQYCSRLAVVDLDVVREFSRTQKFESLDFGEGKAQYYRAIGQACLVASDFDKNGYEVLILDVAPPETLPIYKQTLSGASSLSTVLLIAETNVLLKRDIDRDQNPNPDPVLLQAWHRRIGSLRSQLQQSSHLFDFVIDNSNVEASEVARIVSSRFSIYDMSGLIAE